MGLLGQFLTNLIYNEHLTLHLEYVFLLSCLRLDACKNTKIV